MKSPEVIARLAWIGLSAALAACAEQRALTAPPAALAQFEISNGAHGSGNAHFLFLPPLAVEPSATGALDDTLAPEVEICVWTGPACLYPLTADFRNVAVEGNHYGVTWQTGESKLVAGQTYRIRVLLGAVELGHVDAVAAANASALKGVDASQNFPLVIGRTVPIKFLITPGAVSCDTIQTAAVNDWSLVLQAGRVPGLNAILSRGFFQGTGVLFAGGVLYGTSSADVMVGYNTATARSSFTPGPICVDRTTPFVHMAAALVSAGVDMGPSGLRVTQESYAYPGAPDDGYVLLKYTFTNTTSAPIVNFYSGWLADWDIYYHSVDSNRVRYDAELGLGEATEWDTLAYPAIMAIVPMGPSGAFSFVGWKNANFIDQTGVDPHTGSGRTLSDYTTGSYFPLLAGGINLAVPQQPRDIREMMGLAPLTIPAGQSTVAYFALVGGANRTQFEANVAAARAMAGAAVSGGHRP